MNERSGRGTPRYGQASVKKGARAGRTWRRLACLVPPDGGAGGASAVISTAQSEHGAIASRVAPMPE